MIGDWVRRGWVWTIGAMRSSCSDAIFLLRRRRSSCSFSLSLASIFQGRKSFEVKMKTEIIFHCFGSNFWSTENAFQFDQIWNNNQTPNFPKNHFQNQFEVKTNWALDSTPLPSVIPKILSAWKGESMNQSISTWVIEHIYTKPYLTICKATVALWRTTQEYWYWKHNRQSVK